MKLVNEIDVPVTLAAAKKVVAGALKTAVLELRDGTCVKWQQVDDSGENRLNFQFSPNLPTSKFVLSITLFPLGESTRLQCEIDESMSDSNPATLHQLNDYTLTVLKTTIA